MKSSTGAMVLGIAFVAVAGGYWAGQNTASFRAATSPAAEAHDEHAHGHGAEEGTSLELSEQAWKNLDLKTGDVTRSDYWRRITIPAVVSERPGHSEYRVGATVHGVISRIHVVPGQTVNAGDALFDVQTNGELIAGLQANLLKTIQDVDLATTELKRLEPLIERGDIPGIRGIEKNYELKRLESQRLIQMQELLVRGFTAAQVEQIAENRKLIRQFTVYVPGPENPADGKSAAAGPQSPIRQTIAQLASHEEPHPNKPHTYSIERIGVFPGKMIQPGDELCELAVHDELALTGLGFQRDSELITRVLEEQWPISAVFESGENNPLVREKMQIQYADNMVDHDTHLLKFYIPLDNEVVRDTIGPKGVKYRSWRFKPGQRAQLLIPVEHWTDKVVLPTDAVVKEGADAFVFRQNGKLFERVPVVIAYEDGRNSILAEGGPLIPGDVIAMNEAYQLNLALKKSQGGGGDAHGHSHDH